jgi:transposase
MTVYSGIDLHSNNNYVCVIDDHDQRLLEVKLENNAMQVIDALTPFKEQLRGVAVESTFNWYWLVDALMAAGFPVQLVHTVAVKQYSGLKHTNDKTDAFHLAHLMRLGILPTGYIYPKEYRGLRDLLRKRMQLVNERTKHILSLKTQYTRMTGLNICANDIKKPAFRLPIIEDPNVRTAMQANLDLVHLIGKQVKHIERSILKQVAPIPRLTLLQSICGIGPILAETIMLETGSIDRFKSPGNFASYCRCVGSQKVSNGKKKGQNNRKNGNRYLAWHLLKRPI